MKTETNRRAFLQNALLVAAATATGDQTGVLAAVAVTEAANFNVRRFGAKGDGQAKDTFATNDLALKAARDLKKRFPMLQVMVYDVEKKRSEKIEWTAV